MSERNAGLTCDPLFVAVTRPGFDYLLKELTGVRYRTCRIMHAVEQLVSASI